MDERPRICVKCKFRVPGYSPLRKCPKCGGTLRRPRKIE